MESLNVSFCLMNVLLLWNDFIIICILFAISAADISPYGSRKTVTFNQFYLPRTRIIED